MYQRRTWDEFKRVLSVAHASQPVERAEYLENCNKLSGVCWGTFYCSNHTAYDWYRLFEPIFWMTLYSNSGSFRLSLPLLTTKLINISLLCVTLSLISMYKTIIHLCGCRFMSWENEFLLLYVYSHKNYFYNVRGVQEAVSHIIRISSYQVIVLHCVSRGILENVDW